MPRVLDSHVHLPTKAFIENTGGELAEAGLKYFGTKEPIRGQSRMVADFEGAGIERGLVLAWDAETATGRPALPNDEVSQLAKDHEDLFVPILSVDPHKGEKALEELDRAASRLEMRGVKLHPQIQGFDPKDREWESLWARIEELGLPVIVHTGTSGLGAGLPGGGGLELELSRPINLDPVAARHPELKLIMAHTGWPWHLEAVAMCMQKANVFMDLSGWMPKYLPSEVVGFVNGPIRDKVLFGTDYPFLEPQRVVEQFAALGLKEEVQRKVLWDNGAGLFGL